MSDSLKLLDNKLQQTAMGLGATLTKDETKGMWLPTDFEERSLRWTDKNINYLIQIFPTIDNDKIKGWNFWVVASQDKDKKRYWKTTMLVDKGAKDKILINFDKLFDDAKMFLSTLTADDLEYVTDLS